MYSVKTEDELAAAVQKSKQKNSPAFGLLLEKTFFDTCQKNPSIKEAALLKGGLFSFGAACYDDDLCAYWYKQCRYKSFCIVPGALEYSSAMRVLSAGLNGADRMKDAYSFTPAMIPSNMAAKTDTAERMTQEYPAESESDITDAIREMINSGKASQIPSGGSVEWSVTPTTGKYPVRISLRAGGRECAFTPLDTEPVRVVASFADRNGDIVSTSERLVTPKEFAVNISVIVDKPITLWDSSKRANYSLSPDVLMANTPVRIRAVLNPPFRGSHSFTWNVDAATALTSQDNGDIFIRRGSTGTSEISVTAFNAQGIRAGKRRKYRNNFPSCIDI